MRVNIVSPHFWPQIDERQGTEQLNKVNIELQSGFETY